MLSLIKGFIIANLVFISIYLLEYTFNEVSIIVQNYLQIQINFQDAWTSYLRLVQNISSLATFTIYVIKDLVNLLRTTVD